jgi:hypothetical protein
MAEGCIGAGDRSRPRRPLRREANDSDELAERCEVEVRDRFRADPTVRIQVERAVISSENPERLTVQDAGLSEHLDGRRPPRALVAVAVLDLDRDAGRGRVGSGPGGARDVAARAVATSTIPCRAIGTRAVGSRGVAALGRRPTRAPARQASPPSASIPPLLTRRPGAAFMSEVSSRSRVPATISGLASIASRTRVRAGASDER